MHVVCKSMRESSNASPQHGRPPVEGLVNNRPPNVCCVEQWYDCSWTRTVTTASFPHALRYAIRCVALLTTQRILQRTVAQRRLSPAAVKRMLASASGISVYQLSFCLAISLTLCLSVCHISVLFIRHTLAMNQHISTKCHILARNRIHDRHIVAVYEMRSLTTS